MSLHSWAQFQADLSRFRCQLHSMAFTMTAFRGAAADPCHSHDFSSVVAM